MVNYDKDAVLFDFLPRAVEFYEQYTTLTKQGREWRGPCPLHGGDGPNFTVDADTGDWYCHSRCSKGGDVYTFVVEKEGMAFPEAVEAIAVFTGTPAALPQHIPRNLPKTDRRIVATYDYTDEAGTLLFQVVRYEPKDFRQRTPGDAPGTWTYNLNGVRRVLYHLPEVVEAVMARRAVFLCEGEKDADALCASGLCGTTAPMGAGKWEDGYTETLTGATVILLPDNDAPGREHAQKAAAALHGKAESVRIVELPNLPDKGDVFDWIAGGGTKAELIALAKAVPCWIPENVPPAIPLPHAALPAAEDTALIALTAQEKVWPTLAPEALYGLAGEVVRAIDPHTEADPVAVLVQFLVAFGSCMGSGPFVMADGGRHGGNLFTVQVGLSSKGRKGTSWNRVRPLYEVVAPEWTGSRVLSGLSSGEGLIYAVRDPVERQEKNKQTGDMETVLVDAGVSDKRLLVMEGEFASVLKQTQRDGNTLSATLRNAWDTGRLQSMTKTSPTQATGARISIVGHITAGELRKDLADTEAANGFGNRFLWVCVKRSKELPFGGDAAALNAALAPLLPRLQAAIEHSQTVGEMVFNGPCRDVWAGVYSELSAGKPGLFGAMTGRSEAQVLRLGLLYALLDCETAICPEHLSAALALWEFCADSARYIFGASLGDRVADDILHTLREKPEGMTRNDLREMFGRHQNSERIGQALARLSECGLVRHEKHDTAGRPAERWFAAQNPAL